MLDGSNPITAARRAICLASTQLYFAELHGQVCSATVPRTVVVVRERPSAASSAKVVVRKGLALAL